VQAPCPDLVGGRPGTRGQKYETVTALGLKCIIES